MLPRIILCLLFSLTLPPQLQAQEESETIKLLTEKLNKPIRHHMGAFNFDIFDFPMPPGGPLVLEDAREAGKTMDVLKDFAGKPVVVVELNTKDRHRQWTIGRDGSVPEAVERFKKLYEEYHPKGVEFVSVWIPQRNQTPEKKREEALAWLEKTGLPGIVLLDGPDPAQKRIQSQFKQFVDSLLPGHPPGHQVLILNPEGKFVQKGREYEFGIGYHLTKLALDRLLDPEFEKGVRSEFAATKSRLLPEVKEEANGILYRETFDHYPDDHAFKLEPRWGFTYERQSRIDYRPVIAKGKGRNGSDAAHYHHHYQSLSLLPYGLQHQLPEPLTKGYLSFWIKRDHGSKRPGGHLPYLREPGATDNRTFVTSYGQPGTNKPAGFLMATGNWMEETFVTDFQNNKPGKVKLSADQWQQVKITCAPGQKAQITVDGEPVGELDAESIDWFGFRLANDGKTMFIDDVEIFYEGDPAALKTAHAKAAHPNVEPITPYEDDLRARMSQKRLPRIPGKTPATLPEGAIPRPDVFDRTTPFLTFDFRLPAQPLVLEDLFKPGEFVDVLEKYKGKIILVTKLHKADHANEQTMRDRTYLRSPTVFNRIYTLAKEYQPKGVVVIGIAAVDGGHRDFCTSYADRIEDSIEVLRFSSDFLKERPELTKETVIYGGYPDVFDETLASRFPNLIRLWAGTLRGDLIHGSFAGMGPCIVIDPEGRIVFRGAGPDGNSYWMPRYALDRLLDPEFDKAARQEFRNPDLKFYKSPALPIAKVDSSGLTYRDGFEEYKSAYDLGLYARWGFTNENFPDSNVPEIFEGKGREGSKAALLNLYYLADAFVGNRCGELGMKHPLIAPLTDGHITFWIKRGELVKNFGKPELYRLGVCFYSPDGKPLETLTTTGAIGKETFMLTKTPDFLKWNGYRTTVINKAIVKKSDVPLEAGDAWQKVTITCAPGSKAAITVNDQPVGELSGEVIGSLEFFGEAYSGLWIDDFEIFYKGNGKELQAAHQQAEKDTLAKLLTQWKTEADQWYKEAPNYKSR